MAKETFVGEELLCPIKDFMNIVGGKWKAAILCILADGKPYRYGELKRKLGDITNAMLSTSLKELERDNMLTRVQYNEIPPKVEYLLTDEGKTIIPILIKMAKWGTQHMVQADDGKVARCEECQAG